MKTHVSTVIQNKKKYILNRRGKKHFSPLIFIFCWIFFQISPIVSEGGRQWPHLASYHINFFWTDGRTEGRPAGRARNFFSAHYSRPRSGPMLAATRPIDLLECGSLPWFWKSARWLTPAPPFRSQPWFWKSSRWLTPAPPLWTLALILEIISKF